MMDGNRGLQLNLFFTIVGVEDLIKIFSLLLLDTVQSGKVDGLILGLFFLYFAHFEVQVLFSSTMCSSRPPRLCIFNRNPQINFIQ